MQDNSARRNSNPLPKSNETPIAPRSAAQAPHKKIPVVAAGTVASVNVGGSNGKLQQAKPQVGVSAASRLSTKRELESFVSLFHSTRINGLISCFTVPASPVDRTRTETLSKSFPPVVVTSSDPDNNPSLESSRLAKAVCDFIVSFW